MKEKLKHNNVGKKGASDKEKNRSGPKTAHQPIKPEEHFD